MNKFAANALLLGAIAASLAARLYLSTLGHNYDFDSYLIVVDIVERGGNVYAETTRYNYGPIWFLVLGQLGHLARLLDLAFADALRLLLAVYLWAVDVGLGLTLWLRFGRRAMLIMLLNPLSILISGYHGQFDNLAVLIGLWGAIVFGEQPAQPVGGRQWAALLLFGLSLATKHLLFVFPVWLAARQRGWLNKALVLGVPVAIFVLGFLPHWPAGHSGILANVVRYAPGQGDYFYKWFVPQVIQVILSSRLFWVAGLLAGAYLLRRPPTVTAYLLYLGVLVVLSPVVRSQHLVIPMALMAAYPNYLFAAYNGYASAFILGDQTGPALPPLQWYYGHSVFYGGSIALLLLGLVWHFWAHAPVLQARVLEQLRRAWQPRQ